MLDFLPGSIQGFVKITDEATGEVLVDTHNDVLYGNIAAALAHSLIGNPRSFLTYIAFGNGGAYVNPVGNIAYKASIGGQTSFAKNPTANLYNTIYVKKLGNTSSSNDSTSSAFVAAEDYTTNYADIITNVSLEYNEPPTAVTTATSATIQQTELDTSSFVGTTVVSASTTFDANKLVFNEIGLFAGGDSLFAGPFTRTVTDVEAFVNTGVNFSSPANKLMLTHVIFHPVQKAANRALKIVYTLRIQMGAR